MANKDGHGQASDPRELTLDELDNISAGHGVVIPPQGFDKLETQSPPPKPVNPVGTKII
ncbi:MULTISPECIES: hypothetical protein [unclassified Bradyrhizobium]|uniref:hypothetical protein n=1 Tax=unclassified Bradyrhizobium TaxID=2631580 RepID=UPI001BA882A3|nr:MULTISPECIES: hypothetical protein [unclassified Bradyrhizobium]MBR1224268.1 hypothetical protein [Bradyrhizobium sp. AUGA SZCCT0176]MBR1230895.1 hypothetical protein [Bradyrhizobium sp. AUGA SZCCT0182]MBR1269065.1 hypothetical protein [Bradyrhizobium sp. AUGA SZCCT0222]MBR1283059.1 hypothetical protein [Bradyrhizobium sp. AUGA SZCCT0177]MBR1297772.1 hypothetical protein [Bradyrhizobium sp. AUGA SZCCT0042]